MMLLMRVLLRSVRLVRFLNLLSWYVELWVARRLEYSVLALCARADIAGRQAQMTPMAISALLL